jgi:hypothetical protein
MNTTYAISRDNLTRWAFLVVDLNGPTMFEVHRPGCRDLVKAETKGARVFAIGPTDERAPLVPSREGPDEAEIVRIITRDLYGGEAAMSTRDVRRMPCLRK